MTQVIEDWNHRKEVAKERMAICKNCEKFDSLLTRCNECGCLMILKTMIRNEECPLNKWGKDEVVTS